MLGLTSFTGSPDDTVTLNTSFNWSYGQDVINTIEHEISEGGMGRVGSLGNNYSTMDLFRYNASGVPDYSDGRDGQTTYFSYDGGKTLSLSAGLSFNNQYNSSGVMINHGDVADFTHHDVFGTGSTGEANTLSQTDLEIMAALGWNPAVTVNATSFTVSALQLVAASSFFTISNSNGDSITQYSFEDNGGGSGHFTLAGTIEPNGQAFTVSAGNLGSVQYVGGSSAGTDTLTVGAYDATAGASVLSVSLSAVTTPSFPLTSNTDITEAVYIGYFGRAGDPAGDSYWLSQLSSGAISSSGMAASFAVQTEAIGQYPFLANPSTATQAQIASFIQSVYQDLFNRTADSGGLAYWQNNLTTNLGNPQADGAFILAVIDGAQGSDQATIADKVTVADYLTQAFAAAGISLSSSVSAANALAHSAIASVTSDSSTVLAAESTINSFVATQSHAAEVALVGASNTSAVSSMS